MIKKKIYRRRCHRCEQLYWGSKNSEVCFECYKTRGDPTFTRHKENIEVFKKVLRDKKVVEKIKTFGYFNDDKKKVRNKKEIMERTKKKPKVNRL